MNEHWWETRCRRCSEITVWSSSIENYDSFYSVVSQNYMGPRITYAPCCENMLTVQELVAVSPRPED